MEQLWSDPVFDLGGRTLAWADVVLAAAFWGDLAVLEAQARAGIASERHAREGAGPLPHSEIQAAAQEFRRARRLLAADELQAWLQRWRLTSDEWLTWVRRHVLRAQQPDQADALAARYRASPDELPLALQLEGVCSGAFEALARKLAARLAVTGESGAAEVPAPDLSPAVLTAGRLLGLPPANLRRDVQQLAVADDAFERFCDQAATPQALQQEVASHEIDWLRVDCEYAAFGDENVAREAVLGVREDGLPLGEVATLAAADAHEVSFYLGTTKPELAPHLVSALPGDLLGPLKVDDTWLVVYVRAKVPPQLDDPEIRQRARAGLLGRLVDRAVAQRVSWHGGL